MEKDQHKEDEKELDKALSNEALSKMDNPLTNTELAALAAFFAKESKKDAEKSDDKEWPGKLFGYFLVKYKQLLVSHSIFAIVA